MHAACPRYKQCVHAYNGEMHVLNCIPFAYDTWEAVGLGHCPDGVHLSLSMIVRQLSYSTGLIQLQ